MTLEELKKYDGKDGRKAYIACGGKIYDVTESDFWTGGIHMGRFKAGEDLTEFISKSPHGVKNLDRMPCVGTLDTAATCGCPLPEVASEPTPSHASKEKVSHLSPEAQERHLKLQKIYSKIHPHPISVHFPMGMISLAFFTQILGLVILLLLRSTSSVEYLVVGFSLILSLSVTSVVSMIFGTFFMIPAIASGLFSFYANYYCKANVYLKRKLILSAIAFVIAVFASCLGFSLAVAAVGGAETAFQNDGLTVFWSYSAATAVLFIILTAIGYNGGKITWPEN